MQSAKLHFYKADEMMSMLDAEPSIPADHGGNRNLQPPVPSELLLRQQRNHIEHAYWNSLRFAQSKADALPRLQKPEW